MGQDKPQQQAGVSIHAGFPNPAADTSLLGLDLNKLLIQHPTSTYLFRVVGNDWADSGVFDGDVAIVDRVLDPRLSDTVLWWDEVRGEFAISAMKAVPKGATHWGVVTAAIHQFRKPSPKQGV